MAVTTAILGGRPAMISAATGAVALVIAPLMASHGLDYLIAAVILAGVFQVVLALLGAARLMRFIPRQSSEEHTSELQSRGHLVCRLLLEKKQKLHAQWEE